MRKSFELLDWMKEHFKGGGTVSVDEHTKMLEVPIGEHLSYTSQGIDAKEGDTAQKGVVQLTDAIEAHADHATAATPAAVKEYVDANSSGSSYTFDSPLSESQGRVTVAKADEQNLGVVKLARAVSHGEHPNEAVTPDGVAAYVDAKVADAGGFSIVKAVGSNPDFALVSGDMIKSGKTLYGVLVFTCVKSTALVTEIASLPATLTRSVEVALTHASNSVLQYIATATGSGTVKFVGERSVQQGTYVAVIAAQTN